MIQVKLVWFNFRQSCEHTLFNYILLKKTISKTFRYMQYFLKSCLTGLMTKYVVTKGKTCLIFFIAAEELISGLCHVFSHWNSSLALVLHQILVLRQLRYFLVILLACKLEIYIRFDVKKRSTFLDKV